MSDSDNEFGSLAPTTPLVPVRKRSRAAESRPGPVAGPSKPVSKPARGKPKNAKKASEDAGTADVVHVSAAFDADDDEIVELAPSTKGKGSHASVRSESVMGNGRITTKGKEKARTDPTQSSQSRTSRRAAQPNETTIIPDDVELVEDSDREQPDRHGVHGSKAAGIGKKTATSATRSSANADITARELERLRSRLSEAESQRDTLSQQLEELFRLRNTEVEQLLEQQGIQYEAQIKTQEALINQLTAQAARVEPLTRSGKGSVLHLVTREAADEEKRTIERELAKWKGLAKEKDEANEQDKRQITELQQAVDDLRTELQAEIERNRQLVLSQKTMQSSRSQAHGSVLGTDNPKNMEVIKLYEDLTNFLVSNLRFIPGKDGHEELHFTCYYTHVDPNAAALAESIPGEGKSLGFTLRFYRHVPEDGNTESDEAREMVMYTPQHLEQEAAEFVEQLDFLAHSFNFERDQLPMFLSTMRKNMGMAEPDIEEDGEDEEMEVEEV